MWILLYLSIPPKSGHQYGDHGTEQPACDQESVKNAKQSGSRRPRTRKTQEFNCEMKSLAADPNETKYRAVERL